MNSGYHVISYSVWIALFVTNEISAVLKMKASGFGGRIMSRDY